MASSTLCWLSRATSISSSSAAQTLFMLEGLHHTLQQAGIRLQPIKCAWLAVSQWRNDSRRVVMKGIVVPKESSVCVLGIVLEGIKHPAGLAVRQSEEGLVRIACNSPASAFARDPYSNVFECSI